MPLQAFPINFKDGLDTKTDPWQVSIGKFLRLVNSVFTKGNLLLKRNGYPKLTDLPNATFSYLTTLNDNLTAIGPSIGAYNASSETWVTKGSISPMALSVLPLIRNSVNQIQCDSAIAANGLICTVYTQNNSSTSTYYYVIADSVTGQNIVAPTLIPPLTGAVTGSPRVFLLGQYFVIVFTNVISAVSHLQYIAISSFNPSSHTTNQDIVSSYIPSTQVSWDGVVANNNLYIAYNTTTGGQAIKVTYLSQSAASLGQTPVSAVTFAGQIASMVSLCADTTGANIIIYVSYYDAAGSTGHMLAVDLNLVTRMSATSVITSGAIFNVATAAQNGICTYYYEVSNNYSYDSGVPTHYIAKRTVTLPATVTTGTVSPAAGSASSGTIVVRSVGLASKAFILDGVEYFLSTYQSPYQNTYFLINGTTSTSSAPIVVAKLAYENGGGYLTVGLPNATVIGSEVRIPYLIKDFIAAQNTANAAPVDGAILGVYSQTGINLSSFNFGIGIDASEIAGNLSISGGFLWQYDGYLPVENNFFLYPDSVEITTATTGGSLADQKYFYAATYEWEDNQGNVYRSASSIEVSQTTSGGGTSTNTVNVPYIRLTYKIGVNAPKIVIYRWSVAQPVFYRITSLTAVQLNNTAADSLAFTDTFADSAILGNDILYTTGGVVENVNGPATNIITLFDNRLWQLSAEDPNLWLFSKEVIENTPVEMSDLFTYYIAPSTAAQGPTGPVTAGAPMDDKLISFKKNALYYTNGRGPDNTGANNQYSQPIFITSTTGCSNQKSIVFQPKGLMFEYSSEAGNQIWLLGRDLSTDYIGAPVEELTKNATVQSAVNVPGTNEVRFTLSSGITLMYDYYYGQWGTFVGVPAISSCLYQGMHTFINSFGSVYQESQGVYLDGSNPVLMGFTTGWINLAGLQGYQRSIMFYLLGKYYSPHKLNIQVAYDYNASALHNKLISPNNFSPAYGGSGSDEENSYGQQPTYGGPGDVEKWRIFFKKQRCISFQIILDEVYDPSLGAPAGAGLSLSGLNFVAALKKGYYPASSKNSAGAS